MAEIDYIRLREMERLLQKNYRPPWAAPLEKTNFDIHMEQVQLAVDQMYLALRLYRKEKTEANLRSIVHAKKILECLGYHAAIIGLDAALAIRNNVWEKVKERLTDGS